MSKRRPGSHKAHEEPMHNAGKQHRGLQKRVIEAKMESRKLRRSNNTRLALARLDLEIANLKAKLDLKPDQHERIMLKSEIAHLLGIREAVRSGPYRRRRPPEAGIAVPAVPPGGPLPKQGGAEAPLEFD